MRKVKITTSEPLPGDEPGTLYIKEREGLKRAAERLKGMRLPILGYDKQPTGRFIDDIHQEGPFLVGNADLQNNEFISINYQADEKDVLATLQSNLSITNAYLTQSPRYLYQNSDSLKSDNSVGGNQPMSQPTSTSTPAQTPAAAPPTSPTQTAPPTSPAPMGEQPEEVTERSIRDALAKEQIRTVLSGLNITDEMRGKILGMPLKKAYETMNLFREGITPTPQPTTPAPQIAQSAPPVATPPNANAMTPPAPKVVAGVPYEELIITPPDGGRPHIAKVFQAADIIGRDRVEVPKKGRVR